MRNVWLGARRLAPGFFGQISCGNKIQTKQSDCSQKYIFLTKIILMNGTFDPYVIHCKKIFLCQLLITSGSYTQFIYSNRDVYLYIAIALCSSLLHSAIAI
jgi:hypothetical protein